MLLKKTKTKQNKWSWRIYLHRTKQREHEERKRTHVLDWFLDARDCEEANSFIWIWRNHGGAAAKHQQRWNGKLPLRLSLRCSGRFHFIAPLGRDFPWLASEGFGESAWRSRVDIVVGVRFFDNRRPNNANEVHAHSGAWDSEVQSSDDQIVQMKYTHAVNSFTVSCIQKSIKHMGSFPFFMFSLLCSTKTDRVFLFSTFFLITFFLISFNYQKKRSQNDIVLLIWRRHLIDG